MTQSIKAKNQRISRQRSLGKLQLLVKLFCVDLEQPTLEELGELVRKHRQKNYLLHPSISITVNNVVSG